MLIFYLLSNLVFIFASICIYKTIEEDYKLDKIFMWIFIMLLLIVSRLLLIIAINLQRPSAMDVYKGKTTLEITYREGIPIDSVVVFKYKQ